MTSVFAARRRAEEFDALVDGPRPATPRDAPLRRAPRARRRAPATPAPSQPRPEFVADLRERADGRGRDRCSCPADDAASRLPARRRAAPRRDRRLAAAVGGLAIVGATTSMAVAAQTALPGDALYPVKRAIESAQTGLTVDERPRAQTLLANASGRLDEVDRAQPRRATPTATPRSPATLDDFTDQADRGRRPAARRLRRDRRPDARSTSCATSPPSSMDDARRARSRACPPTPATSCSSTPPRSLSQIDAAAAQACPTCGGAGIDADPADRSSPPSDSTGLATSPAPTARPPGARTSARRAAPLDGRPARSRPADHRRRRRRRPASAARPRRGTDADAAAAHRRPTGSRPDRAT